MALSKGTVRGSYASSIMWDFSWSKNTMAGPPANQ